MGAIRKLLNDIAGAEMGKIKIQLPEERRGKPKKTGTRRAKKAEAEPAPHAKKAEGEPEPQSEQSESCATASQDTPETGT